MLLYLTPITAWFSVFILNIAVIAIMNTELSGGLSLLIGFCQFFLLRWLFSGFEKRAQ
jgi:hypothetical protein